MIPISATIDSRYQQHDARDHDVEDTEARDQVTGKEGRQNMPITCTKIVTGASVALRPHCTMASRRGRHHERHHTEGDHRAGAGHHIGRLGDDLGEPPLRAGRVLRLDLRELDEAQHDEDEDVDDDDADEARLEKRLPQIGCEARKVGPMMPASTPPAVT